MEGFSPRRPRGWLTAFACLLLQSRSVRWQQRLCDFLVEYIESTGAVATSEQAMPLIRESQPEVQEGRAVHTADIHISEPNGTDIWLDIRIGVAKPECSVPKELARMEQEKRDWGASDPSTVFDGIVPVIFEQHGCQGPCAVALLNHIFRRRVQRLEQGSHLTHGVAWMIASRELFAPISCIFSITHYQMFQECCPIVQLEDGPRELGTSRNIPSSTNEQTWYQRDALISGSVSWHGQGSQPSLYSTQGVETTF